MSKAQDILDERLARGELSEADYDRLSARLRGDVSKVVTGAPNLDAPSPSSSPTQVSNTEPDYEPTSSVIGDESGDTQSQDSGGWHYADGVELRGPYTLVQMSKFITSGVLRRHSKVWKSGTEHWVAVEQTPLSKFLSLHAPTSDITAARSELPRHPPPPTLHPPQPRTKTAAFTSTTSVYYDNRILAFLVMGGIFSLMMLSVIEMFIVKKSERFGKGVQNEALAFFEGDAMLILGGLLLLATIALFLTWKYRVTKNVFAKVGVQSVTPAGAVYWYFIPIYNLWKPYEAMQNVWRSLESNNGSSKVLKVWWALTLISIYGAILLSFIVNDENKASNAILFCAIDVFWYLAALSVVVEVSKREKKIIWNES